MLITDTYTGTPTETNSTLRDRHIYKQRPPAKNVVLEIRRKVKISRWKISLNTFHSYLKFKNYIKIIKLLKLKILKSFILKFLFKILLNNNFALKESNFLGSSCSAWFQV